MGFVGKIIKSIFNPDVPQATTTVMGGGGLTARDMVSSVSSAEPKAAEMGASDKKKGGLQSLLVPSEELYKGGV